MQKIGLVVPGLLPLVSCSSGDLTRSTAKTVLSADKRFSSPQNRVEWIPGGYAEYVAQGARHNAAFVKVVTVADESALSVAASYTLVVDEITGIAEFPGGPAMKEVQFRWSRAPIPAVVRPLVSMSGTGSAIVRRYDDGWRVEHVSDLVENRTPPTPTASELSRAEQFKLAERDRQEKARLAYTNLVATSKTASRQIFRGQFCCGEGSLSKQPAGAYVVTDVGLTLDYVAQPAWVEGTFLKSNRPAKPAHQLEMWFACVNSFSMVHSDPNSGLPHPRIYVSMQWANELGCPAPVGFEFHPWTDDEAQKALGEMNDALAAWRQRFGSIQAR